MDVLCRFRAKPILYFAGNHRIIDFALSNCINSGINDIAVATGFDHFKVADYVTRWSISNNQLNNITVLEPPDNLYRGTADAICQNLDYIHKTKANTVVILAADHIYKMDYRRIISFHYEVDADITIGIITVPKQEAYRFGTVNIDRKSRILNFVEKSQTPQSNLASMGIYIFKREVLEKVLEEDALQPDSNHDFGYSIIPKMVERNRVFAYKFNNYWKDIGTIDAYYKTNMEYIRLQHDMGFNGNWPIFTDTYTPSVSYKNKYNHIQITANKNISNSIISDNCNIRGRVENSILSPGVYVDEKAIVRNSVLLPNTYIGYHSIIDSTILEEDVHVGNYSYVGFGMNNGSNNKYIVMDRGIEIPANTAVLHDGRMTLHDWDRHFTTKSFPWGVIFSGAKHTDNIGADEALAIH